MFEELARATAVEAYEASIARSDRSMWISAGSVAGDVDSYDGERFVVVSDDSSKVAVALKTLDSWWVHSGDHYSLGPWKAYNLPVIEEIAAALRPTHNAEGEVLCGVCGTVLGQGHVCSD